MAGMARLLVIQPAFLGDAILTLPLLGQLRQHFPQTEIHYLVRAGIEPLLEGHPWITQTWSWDKTWQGWLHLFSALRQYQWESIIVVQRFFRMGLLGRLLPAKVYITYEKNPLSCLYTHRVRHAFQPDLHETQRVLSLLAPLGLPTEVPPPPWLFPSQEVQARVRLWAQQQPYIVIAPASRWPTKEAPFSLWGHFLEKIPPHYTIYLVGTREEAPRFAPLLAHHPKVHNIAGQLSLLEVAALLQKAERAFTVDSAITHLASAVGCPTMTVFCSTVPAFGFGPLAPKSQVVEPPFPLACRPCGLHGKKACPQGHFRCGTSLSPEPLLQSLTEAPL